MLTLLYLPYSLVYGPFRWSLTFGDQRSKWLDEFRALSCTCKSQGRFCKQCWENSKTILYGKSELVKSVYLISKYMESPT